MAAKMAALGRVGRDLAIQANLARVKRKILVMSGKGGVGKTTVAVNLSLTLARLGERVGLLDTDVHGPSVAVMTGMTDGMGVDHGLLEPFEVTPGLVAVSVKAMLPGDESAVIWRGPKKLQFLKQVLADVKWGELETMVLDAPPGTGDEPLAVAKNIPDAKALIVTTPQEVSIADVRRSITFCRRVGLEVLGVVENMGPAKCPHCGEFWPLFGSGGGQKLSTEMDVPYLGSLPFSPDLVAAGDQGRLLVIEEPEGEPARAFEALARAIGVLGPQGDYP